ncbi:MAG: glycosyltransferase [Bacteroidota bacterium]
MSSRDLIASPAWAGMFELEDLFAEWCDAKILSPKAKPAHKFSKLNSGPLANAASKFKKLTGDFYPIEDLKLSSQGKNVLVLIDLSPGSLRKITSIPKWREKFDLVVGYVEDCCLVDTFPDYISQFDYLFIPYIEYQSELKTLLNIPVKVLPYAFDVLNHGAGIRSRCIDIASYGRTPKNYYSALSHKFNSATSDYSYYHHSGPSIVNFPDLSYCSERFDYLHRAQLRKSLQRSKLTLAFNFDYTMSETALNLSKKHPSYKYNRVSLPRRWYEIAAVGSVIVGKKPKSEMMDTLFGWEDATIELPDDASQGVSFIQDLLQDRERLDSIHHRNYLKSLEINDWRLRFRDMFKVLGIKLPDRLIQELEKLDVKVDSLKAHQI